MKKCPQCDGELPDDADQCPACGAEMIQPPAPASPDAPPPPETPPPAPAEMPAPPVPESCCGKRIAAIVVLAVAAAVLLPFARRAVRRVRMADVPAGEFEMGSAPGVGEDDEHPRHKVWVDAFLIDRREVTVAQYRKFCDATGREMPPAPEWGWNDRHPVVNVTWDDAAAYAAWAGKRLPTEAEWEKACRAGSGTLFSWGDRGDDARAWANTADQSLREKTPDTPEVGWNDRYPFTAPVGTFRPNGYGLYDMHGNVWEWCADRYGENAYSRSDDRNPAGPSEGSDRVVRGGCWFTAADGCRSANRNGLNPSSRFNLVGFRCAAPAE